MGYDHQLSKWECCGHDLGIHTSVKLLDMLPTSIYSVLQVHGNHSEMNKLMSILRGDQPFLLKVKELFLGSGHSDHSNCTNAVTKQAFMPDRSVRSISDIYSDELYPCLFP